MKRHYWYHIVPIILVLLLYHLSLYMYDVSWVLLRTLAQTVGVLIQAPVSHWPRSLACFGVALYKSCELSVQPFLVFGSVSPSSSRGDSLYASLVRGIVYRSAHYEPPLDMETNGSSASVKKQEDADEPDAKGAGKNEPKPPVRTLNRVPRTCPLSLYLVLYLTLRSV